MKGLKTLIKLRKRDIDELKKRMAALEDKRDSYMQQSQKLQEDLENELQLSAELADMGNFFGDFSNHIKKKRQKIAKDVVELTGRINKLTDEIADLFGEMKKYEIAEERAMVRAKKAKEKKQQQQLDEVALRKAYTKKKE